MLGTTFSLKGCTDLDIDKAKEMFLVFNNENILGHTEYGDIIEKSGDVANIYINGVKVAEEPNFLFSYNITSLNKQIKKALNRERTNVGRTAYADRIRSILIATDSDTVINLLSDNLQSMSNGSQCDEIKWVDVASHVVQLLNKNDDVVFVTPDELASTSGSTGEIISESGKKVVFVTENVKQKAQNDSENEISTISTVVRNYNDSFEYSFVDIDALTDSEKENWSLIPNVLHKLNLSEWLSKCFVSEKLKEDPFDMTVGVWDHSLQKIVILRSQLSNPRDLLGTVIHEIIHAKYGASDVSRYFETELTKMIGLLATYVSTDSCKTTINIIEQKPSTPARNNHSDDLMRQYIELQEKYKALLKVISKR